MSTRVGFVVIGRNEGERLRRCLAVVGNQAVAVIYVDSGSTDGSVPMARSMGVGVVELDMTRPFTAARARNAGYRRLLSDRPDVEFVHFLDGDAELVPGWLEKALNLLGTTPDAAVVSGRRRERFPQASVFNRLCDIEWNKPPGYNACEGDALMRVKAFEQAGGFNESLIAGEEPELCLRFRNTGWKVLRTSDDMTLHDAGMLHFWQWWKRETRGGHAYAEGAAMYGKVHYLRQSMSIWFWALVVPVAAVALAWPTRGVSIGVALLLYAVLYFRAWRGSRVRADSTRHGLEYALFCVLGKWPMLAGMVQYWRGRITGRRRRLIEYKTAEPAKAFEPSP